MEEGYDFSTTGYEIGDNNTRLPTTRLNGTDTQGLWISFYVMHLITIVGTLSNILALVVVAWSRRMRSSPSGVLLISLTTIDTIVLISERLVTLTSSQLGRHRLGISPQPLIFLYYIKYTGRCAASFVVACISVNRFAVVVYPLKSQWFMRCRSAIIQVVSSVVCAFMINGFVIVHPPLKRMDNNRGYFIGHVAVEIFISDIILSSVILVLSGITVWTFLKTEANIRRHSESYYDPNSHKKANERQVTVLLLVVALTYVILRIQYKIIWLPVFFMHHLIKMHVPNSLRMAYYITYNIYMLNYATNLYQYCVCSSNFRKEFQRLFCPKAYAKSERKRKISSSSQKSQHSLHSTSSTYKTHHTIM